MSTLYMVKWTDLVQKGIKIPCENEKSQSRPGIDSSIKKWGSGCDPQYAVTYILSNKGCGNKSVYLQILAIL